MTDTIPETHDGTVDHDDSVLTPYRGKAVLAAGITINNASGGLQDALKVDPVELELGATVHVVIECLVRPPQYDPIDKDNLRGPLKLVNRLHALDATFVDADVVKVQLDEQRQRIDEANSIEERRKREAAGEVPLFDDDVPRGGGPASAGDVLDSALGLAVDAEADGDAADARRAELAGESKTWLIGRADTLVIEGRSSMTKAELVDAIVDAEHVDGDA